MSPAGKPPRAGSAATIRVVTLVTEDEREQLARAVESTGKSMGELVRDGLVKIGVLKKGK